MIAEVAAPETAPGPVIDELVATLERDGVVVLPELIGERQLAAMRQSFEVRLQRLRWNNFDGYEKERYRHVVQDLLTLDQGFVDLTLHPIVKGVLNRYLGNRFELVEAKGWKSLPTRRDFHGWHGDAWYDQSVAQGIPREVKLAMYLTDVRSGAFNYVKGSQRQQHPRIIPNRDVQDVPQTQISEVLGRAGTAFLFDTSGTHRQSVPILEPRCALFYNYHDPDVRLEQDNIDHYRNLTACSACALKPRCTSDKHKRLKRWEHEGVLDKMQARLDRMPEAMTIRRQTVEHPFGTLKAWMGNTHFLTKTLEKVKTEMSLQVLAYNMKRMINIFGVNPLMQAIAA